LGNVITIDDERIKNHLDRVIRGSVCARRQARSNKKEAANWGGLLSR
jgi:hypothetical protein